MIATTHTYRALCARSDHTLPGARRSSARYREHVAGLFACMALIAQALPELAPFAAPAPAAGAERTAPGQPSDTTRPARDHFFGGYFGYPWHDRSDGHLKRPGGTDLVIKDMRWDAEPFNFPLYAGIRYTRWQGPFGGMIDFLHDKAIPRTGRGAHGRKLKSGERAIPDQVYTEGTYKGQPLEQPADINTIFERLEFTHGHNLLLPTGLLRLGSLIPRVRPYVGFGAGAALPHVEMWEKNEPKETRTNEYQYGGGAWQFVAGIEYQFDRGPVFVEYKYTWAHIAAALTGGKTPAWCNCDFVSDTIRHIATWLRGEDPARYGSFETTMTAHQVVVGAGYRPGSGPLPFQDKLPFLKKKPAI